MQRYRRFRPKATAVRALLDAELAAARQRFATIANPDRRQAAQDLWEAARRLYRHAKAEPSEDRSDG